MSDQDLIQRGELTKVLNHHGFCGSAMAEAIAAIPAVQPEPVAVRSFPEAADGTPSLPMETELWAAGCDLDTARFVARMLAQEGYSLVKAPLASNQVDANQTTQVIDNARAEWWAAGIEAAAQIIDAKHRQLMISKGRNPDDYDYPESQLAAAIRALATPADIAPPLSARDARIRADERATNTEVTALVDALKCAELIVEDQICNDLYVSGHVENSLRRIRTAIYAWESTNE